MEEADSNPIFPERKKFRRKKYAKHFSDDDTSYGASVTLPSSVSKWTEADLQTIGVSYAATGHENPHDLLDQVPKACKLSALPNSAVAIINYLDAVLDFELKTDEDFLFTDRRQIKIQLETMYKKTRVILEEKLRGLDTTEGFHAMEAFSPARFFIQQLQFHMDYQDQHECVFEQFFTDAFRDFGQMCGLKGESGESIARTLAVGKMLITSYPDIRFKRVRQMNQQQNEEKIMFVTVVEVKKPKHEASETSFRKTRGMTESGDSTSSNTDTGFRIKNYLGDKELGQHGGELLAEWKYTAFNPWVVGMIVCGYKVMLTLLKANDEDMYSLYRSSKLHQIRVVEYTRLLDILKRKDRKILYEVFFRLAETTT